MNATKKVVPHYDSELKKDNQLRNGRKISKKHGQAHLYGLKLESPLALMEMGKYS